jgi:hypothetical protein
MHLAVMYSPLGFACHFYAINSSNHCIATIFSSIYYSSCRIYGYNDFSWTSIFAIQGVVEQRREIAPSLSLEVRWTNFHNNTAQ